MEQVTTLDEAVAFVRRVAATVTGLGDITRIEHWACSRELRILVDGFPDFLSVRIGEIDRGYMSSRRGEESPECIKITAERARHNPRFDRWGDATRIVRRKQNRTYKESELVNALNKVLQMLCTARAVQKLRHEVNQANAAARQLVVSALEDLGLLFDSGRARDKTADGSEFEVHVRSADFISFGVQCSTLAEAQKLLSRLRGEAAP